jgi:LysM repeat protein
LQTASNVQTGLANATNITHTVASGETLLAIALNYDVDMEKIIAANNMEDPDNLALGQELLIPDVIPPTAVPTLDPNSPLTPAEAPLPKPDYVTVNGLTEADFIIMPAGVRQNVRQIFDRGQQLGRNARAFSIVGDSTTEIPFFLARFDSGPYDLGEYAYLQSVIDYFGGSFARDSVAVRVGLHSYTLFDPLWADKVLCQPNEAVLHCEVRLHNPSIIFIRLGSNDAGVPELFDRSIREAVAYAIEGGIVPIIGTKADRHEGSNQNNDILRQIAADFQIPLWEYDIVAGTMNGRGLESDGVHMTTFYPHDYTSPEAYTRGHALHNLTALMVLDTIWKEVILAATE